MFLALPDFFLDDIMLFDQGLREAITPFIGAVRPYLGIIFTITGTITLFNELIKRFINADQENEDTAILTTISRLALLAVGLMLYEEAASFLFFTPVSFLYDIALTGYENLNADHVWFESNPDDHDKNYGGIFGAILAVGFFGIVHFVIMIMAKIFTSYIVLRGVIASNVYYLLGPFAIVLALIPRNEQVVKRLYLEAMSIALWPVLCTLIMSVISQLPFYKHDLVVGNGLMYGLWGIILEGMALFSMFGVADYANNLVAFSSNIAGKGMGNGIKKSITGDKGLKGLGKWVAGNTLGRTANMVMFYNGSVEESFVRRPHTTWMGNKSGKELSWADSTPVKITRSMGRTVKSAMSPYSRKQRLEQANQKAQNEKQTAQENKLYDLANAGMNGKDNNERTPELMNQRMQAGREAAQKAGQNTSSNNKQEITLDPKFNSKTKDVEVTAELGDDNEVRYSGSRVYRGGQKVENYSPMNAQRDQSTIDQRYKSAGEQRENAASTIQQAERSRQESLKEGQRIIDQAGGADAFVRDVNRRSRKEIKGLRNASRGGGRGSSLRRVLSDAALSTEGSEGAKILEQNKRNRDEIEALRKESRGGNSSNKDDKQDNNSSSNRSNDDSRELVSSDAKYSSSKGRDARRKENRSSLDDID